MWIDKSKNHAFCPYFVVQKRVSSVEVSLTKNGWSIAHPMAVELFFATLRAHVRAHARY